MLLMGNMIRSWRRYEMNSEIDWEIGEVFSSDHHIIAISDDFESQLALNNPIQHPSPPSPAPTPPAFWPVRQFPGLQPDTNPRIADSDQPFQEAVEALADASHHSININPIEWGGMRSYTGGSSFNEHNVPMNEAESSTNYSNYEHLICPICLDKPKGMFFGCGHAMCRECGLQLHRCPICRAVIDTRVNLYL